MGRVERTRELARRRCRKAKLKKLRTQCEKASNQGDKEKALEKARKISAFAELQD